jgi:hypothetical protein
MRKEIIAIILTCVLFIVGIYAAFQLVPTAHAQDVSQMTEYTGQQIVRQLQDVNDNLKQILEQTARIKDRL